MVIAREWEEGRRGRSVFNGLQFRKRRKLCSGTLQSNVNLLNATDYKLKNG